MCCQWDGYKNHDEKLNRRDGRGEASKKTVQALNVSFQVKGGDFYWLVESSLHRIARLNYSSDMPIKRGCKGSEIR